MIHLDASNISEHSVDGLNSPRPPNLVGRGFQPKEGLVESLSSEEQGGHPVNAGISCW